MTALTRIRKFRRTLAKRGAKLSTRKEHTIGKAHEAEKRLFAAAVVAQRKEMRLSRRQLADAVGISYGQMSKIELGDNWATMPVYICLVRVLKAGRVALL